MLSNKDYLISLDSVVGDGDLGLTMSDGFNAAYEAVTDGMETDCGKLLYLAGKAMATKVPSTMGTLMASGLMKAGKELKGKTNLEPDDFITLFQAYEDGVAERGKAKIGEKTFLDGFHPGVAALRENVEAGSSLIDAAEKAALAAKEGFENATSLLALHGRAATRGEESRKLKDPGAYVAVLIMEAFRNSLKG
ncbi:MAG: dihydroxyacetone kinase family protein [Bacillota bacterium]